MADDHPLGDPLPLPLDAAHLAHHLPDRPGGHREIVRRAGERPCQGGIRVFQVGQIDVDFPLQCPEGLHPLVAAAVVYHRHRQRPLQRGQDGGQKVGGGHQVDVLRPLGDQLLHDLPQPAAGHGLSRRRAADGGILAVPAAQGAATEKDGTAAAAARQHRLLPFVKHGFGNQRRIRAAAEAKLPRRPVHAALPGA